tara:strand:+ start:1737 stop:2555 length:819 start_codon:yes stop_codon:yes gene_type:complete
MKVVYAGSGPTLYWATVEITVNGERGTYVLDTGSRALVSRRNVGKNHGWFPQSILYGSGRVWAYKTFAALELAPGVVLKRADVLHRAGLALHQSVDGVFGVLPGTPTSKLGLRSVEIDFAARSIYWNQPPVHAGSVCVNGDMQKGHLKGRLWLRGDMRAVGYDGSEYVSEGVHFMLDTGATKAATFCRSDFTELEQCARSPGLVRLEITVGSTTLQMSLPVGSRWPVCLPRQSADIGFVIVGLQALSSLKSIYFEYSEDASKITRLCIAQHP